MYKKILITGSSSKVGQELIKLIPTDHKVYAPKSKQFDMNNIELIRKKIKFISSFDKIVLLHSVIDNKLHLQKKTSQMIKQIKVNLLSSIEICEIALKYNPSVRILIMGSESGLKGSFDIMYALTKSSLHKYVEERKIKFKNQQLICVAPSTIIDGGITLRRKDKKNIIKSINQNPKKRGLKSIEIAKVLHNILFEITDYISNTVLHIHGGKFSHM